VVSFNVEFGLRIPEAIRALQAEPALRAPDLLLLQEMDAPGVEAVARALGLNYVYYPSSVHPTYKRDIGTAVLSPWPVEDRSKVQLPHTSRLSGHARAAVAATVRVAGRPVRAYSLHLGTLHEHVHLENNVLFPRVVTLQAHAGGSRGGAR